MLFSLVMAPGQSAEDARVALPVELVLQPKDNSPATEAIPELTWVDIQVRNGDNLSKIFQRASLSAADVHDIVSNSKDSKRLLRLYPGETLSFQVNAAGKLQGLKHTQNKFESTLFERDSIAEGFSTTHIKREPEIRQNYNSAVISSSLFMAAQNTGLSQNLIMELSDIFGGVIDFVYDVRGGDSFSLLYEEHFLDDDKTGNGPILAAQFTNRGDTFTAYRYVYADGSFGYYNEKGVSMRKAFLRAPLDFTRISSGFNLKRLHPVFKTTRAHRGTDYAASRGTPVYAAGDGRVAKSGYSKANGNYVFINHGSNYTTKYLHLHKRNVRSGQKVKQRQVIGTVGSTGYATGPHLHYEFLVNGVHRNPRTILKKLPKAESINSKDKPLFLAQIGGLQMQLAAYNDQRKLAKAADLIGSSTL
ncbi:MAG: murein DD-endopeptidase MepM/ murein hydrolase activator NlpD [Oceanicoccus sp.]|jgi:murein DD-endopeptidase MepM/ murein hydrolase activator NlpD